MTRLTTGRALQRTLALTAIVALGSLSRIEGVDDDTRREMAARFSFTAHDLPPAPGVPPRTVREVHPSLDHISAWISSVGAAVALADLDDDGLANDVAYVDVRADRVVVTCAPGAPPRYPSFSLDPTGVPYDEGTTAPMGVIPTDANEDGRTDLLVYYWGRSPLLFLRAAGGIEAAAFLPRDVHPGGERWNTNAATFADVDGDGHADLLVGNYFQDGARILDPSATGVESMQHSMTRAYNAGRNRLLLWAGAAGGQSPGVTYREAEGVFDDETAGGWTLALGACDLDGDLLPEIYFANDFGPDRLLHNRSTPGDVRLARLEGRRTLTTPASKVLGHDSFKGMGVDFGDLDADGHFDIYVSNIAAEYALEESHFAFVSTGRTDLMRSGVAPFVERSEPLGLSRSSWGWESRLGDFDNDGVLEAVQATGFVRGERNRWPELQELAIGNDELLRHARVWPRFRPGDDLCGRAHNPFFVRGPSGRFVDIARELGLDAEQVTRGIATADVDGDGDLDFACANQWETSRFYQNRAEGANRFLGLRLLLPVEDDVRAAGGLEVLPGLPAGVPGRHAIGAVVRVALPDGGERIAFVDGGNGHSGVRSADVHVGLGDAAGPIRVRILWRAANGRRREAVRMFEPGWHTVLLGEGGRS